MAVRPLRAALQHLCGNLRPGGEGALSDANLLERWTVQRDEVAFELLLRRHGPMVFALCRRLLGQAQDAEDVFQATFLVLVRRAVSIHKRTALGSWLYKVAYRIALRVRHKSTLPICATDADQISEAGEPLEELIWRDLRPVLDEEVHRLPPRYRDVFVLCYLQGKTNEEAARELGCPLGTVMSRLARARERLRGRLTRRGVTISTLALAANLTHQVTAVPLPPLLAGSTLKNALLAGGVGVTTGQQIPATIFALSQGVLKAMFLTKIKIALSIMLVVSLTGLTGGYVALQSNAQEPNSSVKEAVAVPKVTVYSETGGELTSSIMLKGPDSPVHALAISPDGTVLVWGDGEGTVRFWAPGTVQELHKFPAHTKAVTGVAFSPDGKYLASTGLDGIIYIRDSVSGKILSKIQQPQAILSAVFSADGKFLATSSSDKTIHLWDVPTGKSITTMPKWELTLSEGKETIVRFAADGKLIMAGSELVRFWDPVTHKSQLFKQQVNAQALAISPDGKTLAAGGEDGTISLFDVATGKQLRAMKGNTAAVLALVFSPDGKLVVSSSKDLTIRVWDMAAGKQISQAQHGAPVSGIAISPSGKQLISGAKDGTIKIWDLTTGKQIPVPPPPLPGIAAGGKDRLGQLVKDLIARKKTDEECVEALCLATLGRYPTQTETKFAAGHLAKAKDRAEALEDVLHNLTGTKEFYQHLKELQQRGPVSYKVTVLDVLDARITAKEALKDYVITAKPVGNTTLPNVDIGSVKVGQTISQKVMVKGNQPFRILSVKQPGPLRVDWKQNETAAIHQITITFEPTQAGAFAGEIQLITEPLQTLTLPVTAEVKAASGK